MSRRPVLAAFPSDVLFVTLLAIVTLAVYARACSYGFLNYDDVSYVYENRHVLRGLTFDGAWWALTTTEMVNWHPLTWLSLQLDATLYGDHPWGFHLTNILLHAANAALLFAVLKRMTGAVWQSALVAALFALHPLHVESVAWVSERKDVLSGFFWMLTLWCYVTYIVRPGIVSYTAVALAFGLGLSAKSMLVTLPCVLLLLDYWPLRRLSALSPKGRGDGGEGSSLEHASPHPGPLPKGEREKPVPLSPLRGEGMGVRGVRGVPLLLLEKLPLFALAAASSAMTVVAQRNIHGTLLPTRAADRIENIPYAYVVYLIETFYPKDLVAFHPAEVHHPVWVLISALLVLAALTLFAWVLRRWPYVLVGWLWYVGTLLPVSGLVEIRGGHAMADRYTYIPLIGIFLALAWGLADLTTWFRVPKLAGAVGGAVTLACAAVAWMQIGYWQDSFTLWTHVLDSGVESFFVRWNYGMALVEKGRPSEAYDQLVAALRSKPDEPDVHCSAGMVAASQGKLDKAIPHYLEALRLNPHHLVAHKNLGAAFAVMNRLEDAVVQFEDILRDDPANVDAHYNLGLAYRQLRRPEDGIRELGEAVRLDPADAMAQHQLGVSLLLRGRPADALAHCLEASRRRPDLVEARLNAGLALALMGRPHEALQQYQQAVASQPRFGKAYYFMAQALGEQGDAPASAAFYQQGLELDPYWPEAARQDAWRLSN